MTLMFADGLKSQPLKDVDVRAMSRLYPPASNRTAWESIPPKEKEEIEALAAQYAAVPYPMRLATGFMAFSRNGSRQADEQPYFLRRRKLCAGVVNCCLHPEESLDDVIDGVWCLCEETSWVISAHNLNPIPGAPAPQKHPLPLGEPYVDLFAAQTGMIIALTAHLLGDRLEREAPGLKARMEDQVSQRVLQPFMTRDDFWWMGKIRKDLNNWTPWIISNVLTAACVLEDCAYPLPQLMQRACGMLDAWLSVVPEDGGCDEGAGYWNMAGGALLDCLEILEAVTGGKLVFWENPKLKNILSFPGKAEIGSGWFMNFADCDARPFLSGERLQLAGEKLGDPALVSLGLRTRGALKDQLSDTPHLTRLLRMLFHPASETEVPAALGQDVWLPDLQVRKVCRGRAVLCCKGGHNGDNHNHNDVGSFMLYVDGEPEILDAGNAVYTAKTFSDQRYTLWHIRSAYHNVPLIGDLEQRPGRQCRAENVACLEDGLRLDMAGAYGDEAGAVELTRTMTLSESQLTLRDRAVLKAPREVTWVFMLRHQPTVEGDCIRAGKIRLHFPAGMEAKTEEIPVTDPRMGRNYPGSLWRALIKGPKAEVTDGAFQVTW